MTKISEEFDKKLKNFRDYVALATIGAKEYQKTNLEIIKHLTDKNVPGVYVTLNKPFENIEGMFKRQKIDSELIIFIDAVTETAGGDMKKTDKCLFIGSPENLSDISIAMDQAVRALPSEEKFVFFDSLSTLLVYNSMDSVTKFVHFLASKMRVWKVKGIIVSLRKEKDKQLIEALMEFCDAVLDFGEA